ncbi:hypothetical protein TNCV_3387951 [Trichonephila clavipes]|nr:hypothetical protein TNCV_3387951 [Trichonephila clavipes]
MMCQANACRHCVPILSYPLFQKKPTSCLQLMAVKNRVSDVFISVPFFLPTAICQESIRHKRRQFWQRNDWYLLHDNTRTHRSQWVKVRGTGKLVQGGCEKWLPAVFPEGIRTLAKVYRRPRALLRKWMCFVAVNYSLYTRSFGDGPRHFEPWSTTAPSLPTTTLHQRKDVCAFDRFNVYRPPTRRVFSGTGPELMTRQLRVRYLAH